MAANNESLLQTPVKEAGETFNVAFGGFQGVGKTTLYHRLKTGEFLEGSTGERTDQGLDYVQLVKEVDGTPIKISLWDTANLEKFRSMTQSYFRHVNALILVFNKSQHFTLSSLTDWLGWVKNYSRERVVVSLWRHERDDQIVESENEKDVVTDKNMSEFGLTHDIPSCLQFTVNAKTADSNVENAFHQVIKYLHDNLEKLALTPSPRHTGSFKLANEQRVSDISNNVLGSGDEGVDEGVDMNSQNSESKSTRSCPC